MNDARDSLPPADPPGSDETLSAYLLGELPDEQAAAFEALLAGDPDLGARLDALADALVALGGADQVHEPAGFAARLAERLEAERGAVDLDERRRRRQRWSAMLTAAAGVVVLAVAGVQVFSQGGVFMGGQDMAMEESVEALQAPAGQESFDTARMADAAQDEDSFAPERVAGFPAPGPESSFSGGEGEGAYADYSDSAAGGGTGGSAPAQQSVPTAGDSARPDGPVILDEGAAMDADEQLRARYTALPESERLRGAGRDEAHERAVRHAELIRAAEPFADGVRPDTCLDEVRGGEDARVVTRVERVTWRGGVTVAYVLALPTPESNQVNRFELWLMGPDGCDTRRFLEWQ